MTSLESYKTIAGSSNGIYKEKGSKFFSYTFHVESEDEVKLIQKKVKKEHHSARHHCYAFMLGHERYNFRASDDGEPSGTAGKPILGQINSFELTNVLIIVVRYFGGTLLGTGGLIRAYRAAALCAIQDGTIITQIIKSQIKIQFPYLMMNQVMKLLKDRNISPKKQEFGESCEIDAEIPSGDAEIITNKLQHLEGVSVQFY